MRAGYKLPTPIQRKAIPIILAGHDIVAMARTGSGKTAAFLIPMFEKLRTHSSKDGVRAVILSPTRELAMQTHKVCKSLGKFTDLRYTLLVGGASMDQQFESLANEPDVIIATPGRLMHHLVEVKFSLQSVQLCIFDEADRLFEMGFAAQLTEILKRMSDTRQTCLFSATLPSQIVEFTRAGLHNPQLVRLDVDKKISPELRITFFTLRKEQKTAALIHILQHIIPQGQQTIVFAATRHHVEFLSQLLTCAGLSATHVYGQLDPAARKINIAKFRLKKANIMIVTDVAARGIDIPLLDNVINYDFPSKPKLFVHRVGRVARAGRSGVAYSLVAPDEMPFMIDLHLFLGRHLINTLPEGTQYDDKQVYYGNMPREILEEQSEYVKSLIEDGKLDRLDQVATRAYTLYYKTRAPPSASSVKRVKEMDPPELHPMFAKDVNETEKAVDNMLEAIRGYKSSQTIFEVLESKQAKSKQSTSIMREKRAIHDATIEAKKRTQALKERSEALRRERGLGHEEANAIAQEEMNQKDGMDDGIGDELYDQDEDDDDEAQDEDGDELPDDEVDMDGMEDEDEQEEEDPEQEDDDGGDELMEETKVAPDTKRGVKRKADTITSTSTSATSTSAATPSSTSTSIPTHKPRLSKRARLAAKTGTDITSTSTSIPTSKKKSSFRDENFFISDQPSDKHTDDGYEINANRLEDSVLGLTGDDAETMMKAQQIEKWDRKKKKFIKETVGGDPFRKQRNEAGVLIRPNKDQPSLYEQWKKKSKRGVRDVIQDDDDEEDGDAPPTKKGKKGSTKRPPKDELKSFDEIAKKRIQDEKNKIKNRPGGFKAFNKENKGKFDKMARSHKGGKNTRWKNSKGNAGRPTKGGKGSFKGSSKGKGRR